MVPGKIKKVTSSESFPSEKEIMLPEVSTNLAVFSLSCLCLKSSGPDKADVREGARQEGDLSVELPPVEMRT